MTTFAEAADIFNAAHPVPHLPLEQCKGECDWSEWEFNHPGTCEIRLCAACGIMEQQWVE